MNRPMLATLALIAALLAAGLWPVASLYAQDAGFQDTFDDPKLPGWEHSPNASVANGMLRIEPNGFAFHGGGWSDLTLSVMLRLTASGTALIKYRATDQGGYIVRFAGSSLVLQRQSAGATTDLGQASLEIPPGEPALIDVTVSGGQHQIAVNGQPKITATDPQPLSPGGLLLSAEGAAAEFDEVTLIVSGGIAPTQAATGAPATAIPQPTTSAATPAAASSVPAYQAGSWVFTGGPIGGLGYDIRMDPRNPDVMYVTDSYAGVFKSTDGGLTWLASNNGITTRAGLSGDAIPVFSLTIDPNDPDILWAGTQVGSGVFRSDNGGESWQAMNTGNNGILEPGLSIRGFTIEPGNSNAVYFAGEVPSTDWKGSFSPGLQGLDSVKGVVYKTTDGGLTWKRLWFGDNLARYVWINPEDHNLIYVSTGIFDRNAANSDPATKTPGGVGILRSHDGGQTWEVLDQRNGLKADELYFGSLFMHPQDPGILIAASGDDPFGGMGGVYMTEDGGDTWTEALDALNMSAVEICLSDPNIVYAGSRAGFYRSDDGGHNWQQLGQRNWGPPDAVAGFPIDMQCDPRDPNRVFVNNYGGGNFLSEDGGQNWVVASTGYTGALMRQIVVARDDSTLIYASARSGLFASADGGQNWHGLAYGAARNVEGRVIAVDPFDSQHIIAALGDAGPAPFVSFDGGQNWQQTGKDILEGDNPVSRGGDVLQIAFSPSTPNLVFGGISAVTCPGSCPSEAGGGVILSRDGGLTWAASGLSGENISSLTIDPQQAIYASTFDGKAYRSEDEGVTWIMLTQNIGQGIQLVALAIDPANPQKMYAGTSGAVYISLDGGASWQQSASGMSPEALIVGFAIDQNHPDIVYAASTMSGVFVSTDGGGSWQTINDGLLTRAMRQIALSADGSVLYAATYGAGVFRLGTPPVSAAPTAAPVATGTAPPPGPTQPAAQAPTATPKPSGGGGLCGGAAALPLALVGLLWLKRRR